MNKIFAFHPSKVYQKFGINIIFADKIFIILFASVFSKLLQPPKCIQKL